MAIRLDSFWKTGYMQIMTAAGQARQLAMHAAYAHMQLQMQLQYRTGSTLLPFYLLVGRFWKEEISTDGRDNALGWIRHVYAYILGKEKNSNLKTGRSPIRDRN